MHTVSVHSSTGEVRRSTRSPRDTVHQCVRSIRYVSFFRCTNPHVSLFALSSASVSSGSTIPVGPATNVESAITSERIALSPRLLPDCPFFL